MVVLNRIYTRTGDKGTTALGSGERRLKDDVRLACGNEPELDGMLGRIQNDLFDLGADLCVPPKADEEAGSALRIVASQVSRLEADIDQLNADLAPLRSFVLPGGTAVAAHLHVARTVARRAERIMVTLSQIEGEVVGEEAIRYINRLSDFLFVAARYANRGQGDVLWVPGQNR
jgi:cob(I)alamin adenosyltransferase